MGVIRSTIMYLESTLGTRMVNFRLMSRISKTYNYPITDVVYACVREDKDESTIYLDNYINATSLRELRKIKWFRKLELAKALNISRSTLRRLEISEVTPTPIMYMPFISCINYRVKTYSRYMKNNLEIFNKFNENDS